MHIQLLHISESTNSFTRRVRSFVNSKSCSVSNFGHTSPKKSQYQNFAGMNSLRFVKKAIAFLFRIGVASASVQGPKVSFCSFDGEPSATFAGLLELLLTPVLILPGRRERRSTGVLKPYPFRV